MLLYTKHLCASGVWVAYGSIQVLIEKESCSPAALGTWPRLILPPGEDLARC